MKIKCKFCGKEYSKYGIKNHISVTHLGKTEYVSHGGMKGKVSWSKGKTKHTDVRLKKLGEKIRAYRIGKKGSPHSSSSKKKISQAMKKAHKEGRAWNIGMSRWNNEPSYPEKFIMKVIELNLFNKNYKREFPFKKYSIDFAWVNEKLAVEIDGEQHDRFDEIKKRDINKDFLLRKMGWKILRLKWKEIFNNPQKNIEILKNFVDK